MATPRALHLPNNMPNRIYPVATCSKPCNPCTLSPGPRPCAPRHGGPKPRSFKILSLASTHIALGPPKQCTYIYPLIWGSVIIRIVSPALWPLAWGPGPTRPMPEHAAWQPRGNVAGRLGALLSRPEVPEPRYPAPAGPNINLSNLDTRLPLGGAMCLGTQTHCP